MYELFTPPAEAVLRQAQTEAHRFNHERVGTAHILLALAQEEDGPMEIALANLRMDVWIVRSEIEKTLKKSPDMVTTGDLPWTSDAQAVMEYAHEQSRKTGYGRVASAHLLLAILHSGDPVTSQVLENVGCNVWDVRAVVLKQLGPTAASTAASRRDAKSRSEARLITIRLACWVVMSAAMVLAWLLIGKQVAGLILPQAAAFVLHGGTIATWKLDFYWDIRRVFLLAGFLGGGVAGEGIFRLLEGKNS
ncbi:MAG: hypothetical protein HKL95_01545 [Phycisphaerae bacterium]|nr:hypothetical protein [Phycisphaerae bacterium]